MRDYMRQPFWEMEKVRRLVDKQKDITPRVHHDLVPAVRHDDGSVWEIGVFVAGRNVCRSLPQLLRTKHTPNSVFRANDRPQTEPQPSLLSESHQHCDYTTVFNLCTILGSPNTECTAHHTGSLPAAHSTQNCVKFCSVISGTSWPMW